MKQNLLLKLAAIPLCLALLAGTASATTTTVSSISELNAAIGTAVAGDTIIVANGVYTTTSAIAIGRDGTAANPIVIRAETVGGVEIKGSSGFSFSGASFITIQGFKFTHSSSISLGTSNHHIRITRCTIQLTIPSGGDVSYINISGDDMEIDHCELRNKSTLGEMLDISGSGSQVARRLWVHHNYFHDFTSPGGNGAETIRWGLSGLSLSTGNGLCEYNLFVRCDGENELVSNKSSGNTYRFNTFLDSGGDQLTQRHGDNCVFYGNYFRNTDGLRVFGDNHQIYANYFAGNTTGVDMGNGDGDVHNGDPLTSHDRPDNVIVANNTFITNSTHYKMGGRTGGLGANNIMVFNNIYQGPGTVASISGTAPYIGTWGGNILFGGASQGNMPSSGFTTVNPLLAKDAAGIFHLQSGSPAIGASTGSFPFVRDDQDGQSRDSDIDTGADEFSSATVQAKMLTTADVGPGAAETAYLLSWEAEALTPSATGATTAANSDQNASGWNWFSLQADGAGDFLQLTTPRIPAGTYAVKLSYKAHPSRGTLQLSVDGSNLGGTLNQFSSTISYPEQTFGSVTFASAGVHTIRLTVTGKDASSAAFTLSADRITLLPGAAANVPPTVSVTAPASGATFIAGQNITVSANASDSDGTVTQVQFFDGATLIGTDSTSPYSITWSGASTGGHTITALATDDDGGQTTSSGVNITVNANQSPTVSLTAPANGAVFQLGQNITVSANASDADGSVSSVQFFDGTTSIGTDTTSPYSVTLSGASAGSHTLKAVATDNLGATTTSSTVGIIVNQPPTVSLTSPVNGAAFNQGLPITVTANPADADGSVTVVDFFDGATPVGSATASPWSITWNGAAVGSHSLTARATDDDGAQATSVAIGISVNSTNTGGSVVLYRETFGAPAGADIVSTAFDWQSFESNGVVRTAANINCTATTPGNPTDVANTSSAGPNSDGSTTALATGWHYLQPVQRLSFTPEFSVNPASFTSVKFSWYQLNADATRGTRLAIRIGSQWYVSATVQTGGTGTTTDWGTLSQLKEVTFNAGAANWRLLNFNGNYTMGATPGTGTGTSSTLGNITVGAQPGANLSGTITAFGVFSDGVGTGNSRFDSFTVTGDNSTLPSPWQSADIGTVAVPGSASASGGVFTITGNGADIWTTADEFQFVYQPASGDCDIRARVVTQQNTHAFAKAGVMVRESLNANASEVTTAITPGNGVTFVRRNGTGAASTSLNTAGVTAPQWVRVARTGNTFTAFYSPDGSTWTTIGSTNITMATSVFIGLPVCSHADGTNCTATFDNVTALP